MKEWWKELTALVIATLFVIVSKWNPDWGMDVALFLSVYLLAMRESEKL